MHKHAQHACQQLWMWRAVAAIGTEETTFAAPVDICVTSYQAGRMIDADNLYAKGLIDGIKSRLFPDDSPRWVDSVRLQSRKDRNNPRVEICIVEVNE